VKALGREKSKAEEEVKVKKNIRRKPGGRKRKKKFKLVVNSQSYSKRVESARKGSGHSEGIHRRKGALLPKGLGRRKGGGLNCMGSKNPWTQEEGNVDEREGVNFIRQGKSSNNQTKSKCFDTR